MARLKKNSTKVKSKSKEKLSFLGTILQSTGNQEATIMEDQTLAGPTEWISTGSYALNALISGDMYKGIPNNRVIGIAGEESTGKTYLCIDIIKEAIKIGYDIVYFDSENAVDKKMLADRGVDITRVAYVPVETIESFRSQAVHILDVFNKENFKGKKLFFILDSLSNIPSKKELEDVENDKDKKDMTKPMIIKSVSRVLSQKLARAKIPMIVTNHVYTKIGDMFAVRKEMSGGSGLKYFASCIIFLLKSLSKDELKNTTGVFIRAESIKNRFAREQKVVRLLLDFGTGLNKYYGLQGLLKTNKTQTLKNYCEPLLEKTTITGTTWNLNGKEISETELFLSDNHDTHWSEELLEVANKNIKEDMGYGLTATEKLLSE